MAWKLIKDSHYKCVVYFADGNTRTLFSIDWTHQFSKNRDPQLGLNRLRKRINFYGPKAKTAIIYIKDNGEELERYYDGIKQND
jgi:hypothetical protein